MSEYNYTAVDIQGKEFQGHLEEKTKTQVLRRVKEMGYFPMKVWERAAYRRPLALIRTAETSASPKRPSLLGTGIRNRDIAAFTRQLATLVDAGIPIIKGIKAIEHQETNAQFRRLQRDLVASIEGGSSFSEALARHPQVFSKLYVNMAVAGETGGMIEQTLARLADLIERMERLKHKIVTSMFYPSAVITVSIGVMLVLIVYVVPRFQEVFTDMSGGKPLPAFTQGVIGFAQGIKRHLGFILCGVAGLLFAWRTVRATRRGRRAIDRLKLRLPLFGALCQKMAISRICRTLGTLLNNGVPVLQALTITQETTGNTVFSQTLAHVQQQVKEGEAITPALESSKIFPSTVISMIDVGEQTGSLPNMMLKVADGFDESVDNSINGLMSLLEPVMIVFLAVIVGCIVFALFLPILSLMDSGALDSNRNAE